MTMRRLLVLPTMVLALGGCWGSSASESGVGTVKSSESKPSPLEFELRRELADVEEQLQTSSDEALLDRRLILVAALSALDRSAAGEPPATWSKEELLAAMKRQLKELGREKLRARLEYNRGPLGAVGGKSKADHDRPTTERFRGLFPGNEEREKPNAQAAADARDGIDDDAKDEFDRGGGARDDDRGPPLVEEPTDQPDRKAAVVQAGRDQLSAEARAAIRRQLPRVQQCVPTRSVRTQVRVRAQLHQGRLRAPAVAADPPIAAAVSGCIVEALTAIEVPADPDAPSRVVAFPFVVEAR